MSEHLYLGRAMYAPRPHSRVEPIALFEDGGWRIYRDWTEALPNEGRVFAPRLPGFTADEMVAFHVSHARGEQERDQFVVLDPRRVLQVLDFRGVTRSWRT